MGVRHVIVTDGSRGSHGPALPPAVRADDLEAARLRGRDGQGRAWERFRRVVLTG